MTTAQHPLAFIVEDEVFYSKFLARKLQEYHFRVEILDNGAQLLRRLQDCQPDVVLLDLVMPVMDGFEVLTTIQQQQSLCKAPVIVISNLGQHEDIAKAMGLGAVDFITKSDIQLDEAVRRIITLLAKRQQAQDSVAA